MRGEYDFTTAQLEIRLLETNGLLTWDEAEVDGEAQDNK